MLDLQGKVCQPPFAFSTLCLRGRWYQPHFTGRESEVPQYDCLARVRVVKNRARKLSVGTGAMYVAQADLKAEILLLNLSNQLPFYYYLFQ